MSMQPQESTGTAAATRSSMRGQRPQRGKAGTSSQPDDSASPVQNPPAPLKVLGKASGAEPLSSPAATSSGGVKSSKGKNKRDDDEMEEARRLHRLLNTPPTRSSRLALASDLVTLETAANGSPASSKRRPKQQQQHIEGGSSAKSVPAAAPPCHGVNGRVDPATRGADVGSDVLLEKPGEPAPSIVTAMLSDSVAAVASALAEDAEFSLGKVSIPELAAAAGANGPCSPEGSCAPDSLANVLDASLDLSTAVDHTDAAIDEYDMQGDTGRVQDLSFNPQCSAAVAEVVAVDRVQVMAVEATAVEPTVVEGTAVEAKAIAAVAEEAKEAAVAEVEAVAALPSDVVEEAKLSGLDTDPEDEANSEGSMPSSIAIAGEGSMPEGYISLMDPLPLVALKSHAGPGTAMLAPVLVERAVVQALLGSARHPAIPRPGSGPGSTTKRVPFYIYKLQPGASFQSPVEPVILEVCNHDADHRYIRS